MRKGKGKGEGGRENMCVCVFECVHTSVLEHETTVTEWRLEDNPPELVLSCHVALGVK